MFFDSSKFKVLEAGVQLAWMQQQINTQNIANIETPGYKSKNLSFSSVLNEEQSKNGAPDVDHINVKINKSDNISKRPDGNNVDPETEYIALYKAYAQYSMLLSNISKEFDKYNYVLNANM